MEQHETEAALLPNIANQMRSLLSNLYLAASQVIPPEQREQDPALDAKAAILEQSFFRLLRLVNSMSAAEYLSDSQTLSLRDADLVKLVSEVCESSADLAEQLGIQLKFVCAMDRRGCGPPPAPRGAAAAATGQHSAPACRLPCASPCAASRRPSLWLLRRTHIWSRWSGSPGKAPARLLGRGSPPSVPYGCW